MKKNVNVSSCAATSGLKIEHLYGKLRARENSRNFHCHVAFSLKISLAYYKSRH